MPAKKTVVAIPSSTSTERIHTKEHIDMVKRPTSNRVPTGGETEIVVRGSYTFPNGERVSLSSANGERLLDAEQLYREATAARGAEPTVTRPADADSAARQAEARALGEV
jgi:hypothetical protein